MHRWGGWSCGECGRGGGVLMQIAAPHLHAPHLGLGGCRRSKRRERRSRAAPRVPPVLQPRPHGLGSLRVGVASSTAPCSPGAHGASSPQGRLSPMRGSIPPLLSAAPRPAEQSCPRSSHPPGTVPPFPNPERSDRGTRKCGGSKERKPRGRETRGRAGQPRTTAPWG